MLAILDVLGMTDKRTLAFPDRDYRLDSSNGVTFWGQDARLRIRCFISREALEDHFSGRGRLKPDAAFEKRRADIEAFARRKYLLGQDEPDGSVLVRTEDLI